MREEIKDLSPGDREMYLNGARDALDAVLNRYQGEDGEGVADAVEWVLDDLKGDDDD